MRIFIEGESYPISLLKKTFGEKFYISRGTYGVIDHVGYFHTKVNEVIYLLPKIFIDTNGLLFGKYDKEVFSLEDINKHVNSISELNWLRRFLIIFYRSLIEYRRRVEYTSILVEEKIHFLNTSVGQSEFTFLDIVLSIINFYKKNSNTILYVHKEHISQKHQKVNWEKTITKCKPIITDSGDPIYLEVKSKKKYVDNEEELLSIFYAVLFHLKTEYNFPIKIDSSFNIYKGKDFDGLCKKAPRILRRIRYKYFSDILVKMYKLMEIFFSKKNTASYSNTNEEFIMINNYHVVFEDMVDKLFSDELGEVETNKGISLKGLKENKDGKILDHIFEYESLIDRDENIFFIGDSKYYKTNNVISKNSIYKQFTYAKNVIQFNIDLMNEHKEINRKLRYRDDITEGYNITPNFFIQGKLPRDYNYENHELGIDIEKGANGVEYSYHFKNRIFDRDTLFVHYYKINFLYVLSAYTKKNLSEINTFRAKMRKEFRNNIIIYLSRESNILFYYKSFDSEKLLTQFVNEEFKKLNGKIYRTRNRRNELILAIDNHFVDDQVNLNYIKINNFQKYSLKSE